MACIFWPLIIRQGWREDFVVATSPLIKDLSFHAYNITKGTIKHIGDKHIASLHLWIHLDGWKWKMIRLNRFITEQTVAGLRCFSVNRFCKMGLIMSHTVR